MWQTASKNLVWQIDDSVQDSLHWKKVYLKAILRMKQLEDHEAFETSSLIGHSARVYALYYKDGLLCTGKEPGGVMGEGKQCSFFNNLQGLIPLSSSLLRRASVDYMDIGSGISSD